MHQEGKSDASIILAKESCEGYSTSQMKNSMACELKKPSISPKHGNGSIPSQAIPEHSHLFFPLAPSSETLFYLPTLFSKCSLLHSFSYSSFFSPHVLLNENLFHHPLCMLLTWKPSTIPTSMGSSHALILSYEGILPSPFLNTPV